MGTPQYPTPESPKNAGILGKFMLVKIPDDQLNSDFLLVEKSGGKKSLVKLDEKIGNDERIERPMGKGALKQNHPETCIKQGQDCSKAAPCCTGFKCIRTPTFHICMSDETGKGAMKQNRPRPCKKERKLCSEAKPCCPGLKCLNPKPGKPNFPHICLSDGTGMEQQRPPVPVPPVQQCDYSNGCTSNDFGKRCKINGCERCDECLPK